MSLLAIVSLLIALPSGQLPAYAREPGYLDAHVANTVHVAKVVGLPVARLAALYVAESHYNQHAVSFNGTSVGLPQINVRSRWYRQWQAACRAVPSHCQWSGQLIGARVLKTGIVLCRSFQGGVGWYRTGRCVIRKRDRDVVRLAQTIAWRLRMKERS